MLQKDLTELYQNFQYENNILDNDTRISNFLSFAGKLRELKTLKDNLNNHRIPNNKSNIEKLDILQKDVLNLSEYFQIQFDTKDVLSQSRIKNSDIDDLLSNQGMNRKRVHNHEITKKVYNRYQKYKEAVIKHLDKGGELYDYVIKVSSGKGNNERLQKVIDSLNKEGYGIVSQANEAHSSFHTHEMVMVTNSLHANKIITKLKEEGAGKNSLEFKTVFLMPNPNNILIKDKVENLGVDSFDPDKIGKAAFSNDKNILAFRKENYINPQRQFGGITAKGLTFRVQGKDITNNNAYLVKNPLEYSEINKKTNTRKLNL